MDSEVTLNASWTWGSRVNVAYNWGDGTSDVQMHPGNARHSEYTHRYAQPGTYFPTVSISNYLIDCSNQTLQLFVNDILVPIQVLGPILGLQVSPKFTGWQRGVPFELSISIENGTMLNLTIDWNDTTSDLLLIDDVKENFSV